MFKQDGIISGLHPLMAFSTHYGTCLDITFMNSPAVDVSNIGSSNENSGYF